MKQVEKYIYMIIIIILVAIIASGATYMVMKNKDKNKENENNKPNIQENNQEPNTLEDGIKLKRIYELNDNIIEEYEVTLNKKAKTAKIIFKYDYDAELLDGTHTVIGYLNNSEIFVKEISDKTISKKEVFNLNKIKEEFNEQNFQIIKGTDDKSYFLTTDIQEQESFLHIFNDNFDLLSENIREDDGTGRTGFNITYFYNNICELENETIWYKDNFGINTKHIHIKIEDNKIYFLTPILKENDEDNNYGVLEERVYTINNDKLEYKTINTYKITGVCQQI